MGTEDQSNSEHRGLEELWIQRTIATVGTEDQRNCGYRGPEQRWAQRTRGAVGTEDQRNSGYRGPEEQWTQRTRGTEGTEDQRNIGNDQTLVRRDTESTSQASKYPVSQLLLFVFKMAENGLFSGISSADNKKTKQRIAFFSGRNVFSSRNVGQRSAIKMDVFF